MMNENTGIVSWTRLYKSDDEKIKLISNKVKRTKAQIIRMLVHEGIKNNIIKEFECLTVSFGKEKHVVELNYNGNVEQFVDKYVSEKRNS